MLSRHFSEGKPSGAPSKHSGIFELRFPVFTTFVCRKSLQRELSKHSTVALHLPRIMIPLQGGGSRWNILLVSFSQWLLMFEISATIMEYKHSTEMPASVSDRMQLKISTVWKWNVIVTRSKQFLLVSHNLLLFYCNECVLLLWQWDRTLPKPVL